MSENLANNDDFRRQFRKPNFGEGIGGFTNSKKSFMTEEQARHLERGNMTAEDVINEGRTKPTSEIDLSFFKLEEVPEKLLECVRCETLYLQRNFLTRLPIEFGRLSSLTRLIVRENRLESIPDSLGFCEYLTFIDLSNNHLSSLPESMTDLCNLRQLVLDFNFFSEIPQVVLFGNLSLEELSIIENPSVTSLPPLEWWPPQRMERQLNIRIDNTPELIPHWENLVSSRSDVFGNRVRISWNKIWPDEVLPNLFLGSLRAAQNRNVFSQLHLTHVLSCGRNLHTDLPPGINQKVLEVDDSESEALNTYFLEAINFIDSARDRGTGVLVHCFAGVSRSATIVVAYLIKKQGLSFEDALEFVRNQRPAANPNPNFRRQLEEFAKNCGSSS